MVRGRGYVGALVAVVLLSLGLSACTPPAPTPTPTPTGFADEDAAFAAAEETYRAYVDALNHVDLSDPATFEDVYAWTTGAALDGEKKSLSGMHAEGWTVAGASTVASISPDRELSNIEDGAATLRACSDVSEVTVTNAVGESMVDPNRPQLQSVIVTTTADSRSKTGWLISDLSSGDHRC
ncbi:MAG: hypothetical protein NT132_08275 [Microbacterium sp.]|uniref:hypothetical protein n=1 Tax=Microbacterium sp. TaxID=51671 RepID=UPI0026044057|nr:hypothetical protein [Microbacterium sp.]MCX6502382.1 hypothetical protein [Microbacterium sp.]